MRFLKFVLLPVVLLLAAGCSQSPEKAHARSMAAGVRLMKGGDYRRAALEFKNAIQAMPRDAEAQCQLGNAFAALGDAASAAGAYRRATELNPKHAEAQQKLAELLAVLGDRRLVEEAEKRLRFLLDASPTDLTALNTLAFAELKLGKHEDAVRHLEEVLAKAPLSLAGAVLLAQAKLQDRDIAGAEELLKRACALNPGSADVLVVLGRFYTGLDRLAEAGEQFQHALRIQPKNAPALFYLAMLENSEGRKAQAEEHFKALSGDAEKVYWPIYGMFLFQEGRRTEAIREFERLYKMQPDDRTARTRLVNVYLAVNRPDDAEKLVTDALKRNSKDMDALLQRSELRLNRARFVDAQSDLDQVLHANQNMPEAHFLQARLYEKSGLTYSQRQELDETLRLSPLFLPARIVLARLLINTGASKTALQVLDETPAEQKASLAVLVQRNWIFAAMGKVNEMRAGVQQGLTELRTPDLLIQDALLKLDQKDFKGARASVEEALELAPDDVRALEVLARSYARQDQNAAGIARIREYASRQPRSAAVQLFLGKWLSAQGDHAGARAAFLSSQTADSDSTDAALALAQLDLAEAKWQDARQRIWSVLNRNGQSVTARYWLAQVEEIQGNHKASIEQYRRVIAADPTNVIALNNLAYLLCESTGLPGEALPIAQRAKELAPDNPAVTDTLGWVLYRNGMYSLAVRQMEEANAIRSTARRLCHLSLAYLKTGAEERARQTLDRATRMEPTLPDLKQVRELLAKPAAARAN